MKTIKELVAMIEEEMRDAEKYAKCALKSKDENDTRLAETFYLLSKQEHDHANLLHEQAERLIREYGGEPSPAMQAVYDWEHEKQIDNALRVKSLHDMYKS